MPKEGGPPKPHHQWEQQQKDGSKPLVKAPRHSTRGSYLNVAERLHYLTALVKTGKKEGWVEQCQPVGHVQWHNV